MQVLGVIPARYKSSRFPGKPLVPIAGIPMLKRTYMQAKKSKMLTKLVVATDDPRISEFCKVEGIPVEMTSENCLTGTDRVVEISRRTDYDFYVNIQGDEPVIDPSTIDDVIKAFALHCHRYCVYNMYKLITDPEEEESPAIIKVAVNLQRELMYMSRLPIPYEADSRYRQVCVYGFTSDALFLFSSYAKTPVERVEDIEILRFLEMGIPVKMIMTNAVSISVDVPEDVAKVERFLMED
jgi:3-deoxy-D-manno-octulosonate cytidylyltransferase